jgi:hypothetical protein
MSRWVSLNQARAKASANSSGFSWKRLRDLLVDRVHAHRHVGGGHHRRCFLTGRARRAPCALIGDVLGQPLPGAGRALGQLPLVAEQHIEVAHVPLGRVGRPGAFDAAGDGVAALAAAEACSSSRGPAPRCGAASGSGRRGRGRRRRGTCRRCGRRRSARRSPRRSSPCGRRSRGCRGPEATGSGLPFGALRVHVDQAHLHGGQRVLELAVAAE